MLTLEPGAAPISPGYVAVTGSRIEARGRADAASELPPARQRLDAGGRLVMPGLVNTHCHAPMVWFRGLADDLALNDWLSRFIFPAEGAWLDGGKAYWGALLAAAEMIRGGITTVADGYFHEAQVRRALDQAGLRAVCAQGVVDFPAPGVPDPARNLDAARAFLDSADDADTGRITSTLFCHSPYTCGPETLTGAKELTRSRHLPYFLHLAETRREVEDLIAQTGLKPAFYLDRLGVLDGLTVAVHGVWLEEDELELLARRGVNLSHCPESNAKLGAGLAPAPAMLALGLTLGLGTDGAASNNNLDLWGEMSLAARLHKAKANDPTVLPASQVVGLATRDGARVLNLHGQTGTLTPGKEADLIIVDLNQPHLTPLYEPFSHLVYAARAADVTDVMVAGRWLLRERRLTTLDEGEILQRLADGGRELAAFVRSLPRP